MLYRVIGWARWCFSYLPCIGLVKRPPRRPNGISAIIRSHNDEWIEYSLKSIKDFADEIIVVDTSTNNTPAKIEKLAEGEGLRIKLLHFDMPLDSYMYDTETYVYQSNIGLRYTNYRWAVIWDSDYIAFTSGNNNILKLKELLSSLDPKKYFHVHIKFIDLYGDLFHTIESGIHIRRERFAFTWSPNLKFYDEGRFERMHFPLYYRRILLPQIHVVHLATVKNAKYLLYRRYWTDWREMRNFQHFPTLQEYVKSKLIKCDYLLKDCPEVLKDEIKKPRYRILYRNGKIIGRNDIGIILKEDSVCSKKGRT